MPVHRDFKTYHRSIASEMQAIKDRVRNLIGGHHWQSDGEHKEAILRKILRSHVAQSLCIGHGFVCTREGTSTQIDILIAHRNKPALFRDGEMLIVTPDAVACLIEVKTRISSDLNTVLDKLAANAALVRAASSAGCVVGLFVYEELACENAHHKLLGQVQEASQGNCDRIINWVAAGPNVFVRHWSDGSIVGSPVAGPVWHSYSLERLSHAYFVSNVVWETCPDLDRKMQYAWFPVEGGKERHREWHIALSDPCPQRFKQ